MLPALSSGEAQSDHLTQTSRDATLKFMGHIHLLQPHLLSHLQTIPFIYLCLAPFYLQTRALYFAILDVPMHRTDSLHMLGFQWTCYTDQGPLRNKKH